MSLYSNDIRKMTDEEREAQLRADPRLGDVEPGRVFCKMCNSWIRLNMATGFLRGNWLRHAERCKGKSHWEGKAPEAQEGPPELRPVEIIDLDDSETLGHGHFGYIELGRLIGKFEPTISSIDYGKPPETKAVPVLKQQPTWSMPNLRARTNTPTRNGSVPLPQSTSEPKVSDTGKRMHRSEESRKLELENDDRTKIVQPDKILCAMCDRWIQMRRDVSYSPQNWLKHAGICEQRTGWLKRNKAGKPENNESPSMPVTREPSEDPVPYNARVRAKERSALDAPPALKPVDWDQIVGSDDDDDDESTMADVGLSADTLPSSKHNILSVKTPASTTTGPESPSQRLVIPTPLTSLRTSKAETKILSTSSSTSPGVRIPPSSSPPMVGPFTTVPLSFYRPTYPQHVVQHGYNSSKDGIPVKGASPHNGGGAQRPVPFVVPHLLPRPVLVPISHAAGQRSAIPSPFRLPATPPLPPPVGIAKTNTPMLTPPPTAPMTNGAASPASANPPQSAQVPREASGVAVPTPVRSVLEQPTIASDAAALDKSPLSPPAASGKSAPRKSSYGPVGPGVLQLAPESSTKQDTPTVQKDIMSPPPTAGVTNKEMSVPSESLPSEHLEMHPIIGTGQEAMSAEA
ncbi:uncharacterized protein FOMMEDRAFT_17747 [Fomitiporia mediterranea MF3/22]|uniref:uncharacterized protein n=1 Tax=Fomitiporia mediterranea (strain MF3/22) TaxID=694068 RepID=UPI000440995C|nr:uncharacterized protein FOMMEDRAFT_17747 [Fomitiporia mediterranea MF3/22]EJD05449.1 hypothetical protein FOMMEDRAFT_17747 [Fomitiporia mediterranea MF3/22]